VDKRLVQQNLTAPREQGWIPSPAVAKLRDVVIRYLDGERNVGSEVELVATAVANAAHAGGHAPERMLIAVRELWRDFAFSQHDRLQLAGLYDRLVRRTIDHYYHT
jgi:hypothetical protein